jgi:mRNA-degrading endonuclease RelE of RelBE toxin-antitoxin system
MAPFELDIPPHVAEVLRHLAPDIKRPVKAALRAIGADPSIGAPLEREKGATHRATTLGSRAHRGARRGAPGIGR